MCVGVSDREAEEERKNEIRSLTTSFTILITEINYRCFQFCERKNFLSTAFPI